MLILCISGLHLSAQKDYLLLRSGDELYQQGQYTDAETMYRKAMEEKQRGTSAYNLGNSVYAQDRMKEASEAYKKAIANITDPELKSNAYYNLGNTLYQQLQYAESIQAYKEALKLQPADEEAKKNLTLAMRQLHQQQKQEQQQNQNQDQQQKQKEEEKKDQEQQKQDQQKQDQQQQQQQQQRQQQQQQEDVSKDEARDILKAIEREDQRVQEKLKKAQGNKVPSVKDW